jgi:hypothetical protein
MQQEMWSFREELGRVDVTGFSVEAVDGRLGKVDEATLEPGSSHLVVDTGVPIVGKKVLLPASLVTRIDRDNETVHVTCSESQVKKAPEFDSDRYRDPVYRDEIAAHYSTAGAGIDESSTGGTDGSDSRPLGDREGEARP